MTRYAANLSMMFTDVPFLRRFEQAAVAGFEAVEFLWPTREQLEGRPVEDLAGLIRSSGLQVGLFNFDAGDMAAGWRGLAGVPEARDRFRDNLPVAIGLAREVGCRKLNALAGVAASAETRQPQLGALVEGLTEAAEAAGEAGISVMLEALNPVDVPAYLVLDSGTALDVIARTKQPNVKFQFDVYHARMAGEDPVAVIAAAGRTIGHVQFADIPGRHEPGTGTTDWAGVLAALDAAGYADWIGLEYIPTDPRSRDFGFVTDIGGDLRQRTTPHG
jgi:hydroxypyruvate isomerase